MPVWLRLTHLFGLPEGPHADDLMQAALGPVLRAACQDVVDAPLPQSIARLVHELVQREWPIQSPERSPRFTPIRGLRPHDRPRRHRRVAALPRAGTVGASGADAGELSLHKPRGLRATRRMALSHRAGSRAATAAVADG
jgi:hypothetical protein